MVESLQGSSAETEGTPEGAPDRAWAGGVSSAHSIPPPAPAEIRIPNTLPCCWDEKDLLLGVPSPRLPSPPHRVVMTADKHQ